MLLVFAHVFIKIPTSGKVSEKIRLIFQESCIFAA